MEVESSGGADGDVDGDVTGEYGEGFFGTNGVEAGRSDDVQDEHNEEKYTI